MKFKKLIFALHHYKKMKKVKAYFKTLSIKGFGSGEQIKNRGVLENR